MRSKKRIIITLIVLIIIASCTLGLTLLSKEDSQFADTASVNRYHISIAASSGVAALSLAGPLSDNEFDIDYEIAVDNDALLSEFTAAKQDLIIAPINLGLNQIKNNDTYRLLGIVSWGNYHIVGNTRRYQSINAFGPDSIPGVVLDSVHDIIGSKVAIDYLDSSSEVASKMLEEGEHVGLMQEPMLTKIRAAYASQNEGEELFELFDLQALYEEETGFDNYPVNAIFIKDELLHGDFTGIIEFISRLDNSIQSFNANSSKIASLPIEFEKLGFVSPELLSDVYPRLALNFIYANECVDEINALLKLFGLKLTSDLYVK